MNNFKVAYVCFKFFLHLKNCQYLQQVPTTSGTSGTVSTTTRSASIAAKEAPPATISPLFDKDEEPCTSSDVFNHSR